MRRAAFIAAIAAGSGAVVGADFQINPRVEAGGLYNDNIRLDERSDSYIRVSGGYVDVSTEFRSLDTINEISATPRVRATYFPGDDDENSVDVFFSGRLARKFQKGQISIVGEAAEQDTINSEVPLADFNPDAALGQGQGADAGYLDVPNKRRFLQVRPEFEYRPTLRTTVGANVNLTDVSYEKLIPGRQDGYRDYTVNGRFGYAPSARTTWRFGLGFSRFESDTQISESDTLRLSAELAQRVSANQEFYVRGGVAETELDTRTGPNTRATTKDSSFLAGAGVRWGWVRSQLFLETSYDVAPTSTGLTAQRLQGGVWYTYNISPTLRFFGAARAVREDDQGDSPLARERDYYTFGGGADWRFRRDFTLGGRFDYVNATDRGGSDAAQANSVSVWLRWQPPRRDK